MYIDPCITTLIVYHCVTVWIISVYDSVGSFMLAPKAICKDHFLIL